jgi:Uma2 family endonuclease
MIMHMLNPGVMETIIERRKKLGRDRKDEVWDGVYVITPDPTLLHQHIITRLICVLIAVVDDVGRGRTFAGTNVSDRRQGWKKNFRVPDVVVVLNGGRAVDCATHWFGGPDFVVEVRSPGDDTDAKIPFYGSIGVRELLIIDRDTRRPRLYRHEGGELVPVEPNDKGWLTSAVLPLVFRRSKVGRKTQSEIRRTDGKPGRWVI